MNEEQLIATLQACYFGDRGAFNKILKEYKQLQNENKELKEKINQYENPDDLTLFYMWLDEKAKDKMKCLEFENQQLTKERNKMACLVNDLQETLEEIREYIKHEWFKRGQLGIVDKSFQEWELNKLLQLIDKGVNNEL